MDSQHRGRWQRCWVKAGQSKPGVTWAQTTGVQRDGLRAGVSSSGVGKDTDTSLGLGLGLSVAVICQASVVTLVPFRFLPYRDAGSG